MTDLAELRRLAEAATPGPWRSCSDLPVYAIASADYRVVQTPNQNNYRQFGPTDPWHGIQSLRDADFIAAANPATILSILDRLEAEIERRKSADRERDEAIEALKPFAAITDELENEPAWSGVLEHDHPLAGRVTVSDFRNARAHVQKYGVK